MKHPLWKTIVTWCCVLIYLVIGTITLDSSDIAEAKDSQQVTLLDSLDEFAIDSVLDQLGLKTEAEKSIKTLLLTSGESEEEIGLSIEGAAPGNIGHISFKAIVLADFYFISPPVQLLVVHKNTSNSILARAPPDIYRPSQLLALKTVILTL